jgi:RNA polymerase sigma factor (TIGR02999 family)
MTDVTRILSAIEQGDPHAAEQLLPLVYDELRNLAAQKLAQEKPGQTLQATALVHEAFLRLLGQDQPCSYKDRRHFFRAAATAMRRILIDNARRKRTHKRGGGVARGQLEEVAYPERDKELLALDEALTKLQRVAWLLGVSGFGFSLQQAQAVSSSHARCGFTFHSSASGRFA